MRKRYVVMCIIMTCFMFFLFQFDSRSQNNRVLSESKEEYKSFITIGVNTDVKAKVLEEDSFITITKSFSTTEEKNFTTTEAITQVELFNEETQNNTVNESSTEITTFEPIVTTLNGDLLKEQALNEYDNFLIIGENIIPLVIDVASQSNVDDYEAVQDNYHISDENRNVIFGHDNKSFKCLKNVEIDENIYLSNGREVHKYNVFRSELAFVNEKNTTIFADDGQDLVYGQYEGVEKDIRLVTCANKGLKSRWVVTAKLIE